MYPVNVLTKMACLHVHSICSYTMTCFQVHSQCSDQVACLHVPSQCSYKDGMSPCTQYMFLQNDMFPCTQSMFLKSGISPCTQSIFLYGGMSLCTHIKIHVSVLLQHCMSSCGMFLCTLNVLTKWHVSMYTLFLQSSYSQISHQRRKFALQFSAQKALCVMMANVWIINIIK